MALITYTISAPIKPDISAWRQRIQLFDAGTDTTSTFIELPVSAIHQNTNYSYVCYTLDTSHKYTLRLRYFNSFVAVTYNDDYTETTQNPNSFELPSNLTYNNHHIFNILRFYTDTTNIGAFIDVTYSVTYNYLNNELQEDSYTKIYTYNLTILFDELLYEINGVSTFVLNNKKHIIKRWVDQNGNNYTDLIRIIDSFTLTAEYSSDYIIVTFYDSALIFDDITNKDLKLQVTKNLLLGDTPKFTETFLYSGDKYVFNGWKPALLPITEYGEYIYTATYKAIYNIIFLNYDGTILQLSKVLEGDTPVFTGTIPKDIFTKFDCWYPLIEKALCDIIYTATYIDDNTNAINPIMNENFGKYKNDNWHFITIPVEENKKYKMRIKGPIAELKFLKEDPSNLNDPVLQYWNFRNSEGPLMFLWKHGLAGLYDNQGKIKPAHWYGKQHEFNFEFVVNETSAMLKIFNNLKILSNKAAPNKFEYEIVGETYDWYKYKPIIEWINNNYLEIYKSREDLTDKLKFESLYKEIMQTTYDLLCKKYLTFPNDLWEFEGKTILKIPFLHLETCDRKGRQDKSYWKREDNPDFWSGLTPDELKDYKFSYNCSETVLIEDEQLNEQRVHTESLGNDMKRYGRIRGNMLYLEDLWDIEIRPVNIKWAYLLNGELKFKSTETRHRDKYLKVKVRYTGEDLVLILGIITMFDLSYA